LAALYAERAAYWVLMHTEQETEIKSLSDLFDAFQATGRYVFRREEALSALVVSEEALKKPARRLAAKGRIAIPLQGF